jgi:DNA polymerase-3 subunit delta
MAVNFQEVQSQLNAKKYAPVYFLHGDEPFYIDKISQYIEANVLSDAEKGFNQTVLYGRDVDVATILNCARRFPMMSEKQVVIVKEAQDISNLTKADGEKLLVPYLENPLPSTLLVFAYKHKKLDLRTKVGKAFDKKALVMESKKLYDNQVPAWVTQYIREKGTSIDEKACFLLSEYVGNNLERLSHEIDKILINFEQPTKISTTHVQKYVGISKDYNVFELQKAISMRNMPQAIKIAQYFEANPKSNPLIPVISNIFTLFTKILLIHKESNKSEAHISSLLGVHKFFVGEYLSAARNYNMETALINIGHIREADLKSKGIYSGSMVDSQILKELLIKTMG